MNKDAVIRLKKGYHGLSGTHIGKTFVCTNVDDSGRIFGLYAADLTPFDTDFEKVIWHITSAKTFCLYAELFKRHGALTVLIPGYEALKKKFASETTDPIFSDL